MSSITNGLPPRPQAPEITVPEPSNQGWLSSMKCVWMNAAMGGAGLSASFIGAALGNAGILCLVGSIFSAIGLLMSFASAWWADEQRKQGGSRPC